METQPVRDPYVRAVEVVRVIDGDTFVADVDLGFHLHARMSCRLAEVNAPEHDQPGGPEAKAALTVLLSRGTVTVESVHADKYAGRFDARVVVTNGEQATYVNKAMVDAGLAVTWDATGPRPLVPWPPNKSTNLITSTPK
jgi:endonuclease YncB( thermonuclease family)